MGRMGSMAQRHRAEKRCELATFFGLTRGSLAMKRLLLLVIIPLLPYVSSRIFEIGTLMHLAA